MRLPRPFLAPGDPRRLREVPGATVEQVLQNLATQLDAEVLTRLFDGRRALRSHVNVYVNGDDVRFRNGPSTPVQETDEVALVPAIAGGAGRRAAT